MKSIWFLISFLVCFPCFAQELPAQDSNPMQQSYELYQKGDFKASFESFQNSLAEEPATPGLLTNAGLAAWKAGLKGWALAYWRKALSLSEEFPQAKQALNFLKSQGLMPTSSEPLMPWEIFRSEVLLAMSPLSWMFVHGITLLIFGLFLIRFLTERKKNKDEELPPPQVRKGFVFSSLLWIIVLIIAACAWFDKRQPRATLISSKTEVRLGPSNDQPALFELNEGLEVLPQKTENNWVLIVTLGGRRGWVAESALYITAGRNSL